MGESFAVSQFPSLPPQYRFHASNGERNSHVGYNKLFNWAAIASTSVLKSRAKPGVLSRTICAQSQSQKRLSPITSTKVVSNSILIVKSAGEEIDIQPESGGGDGFGIGGGDGGGGGGDKKDSGNNNHGEGESEESDDCSSDGNKKMAMTMSQKLTFGYAALIGGLGNQNSIAWKGIWRAMLHVVTHCSFGKLYPKVLPTKDILASRFPVDNTSCPLSESYNHLFLECAITKIIWRSSKWPQDHLSFLSRGIVKWITKILNHGPNLLNPRCEGGEFTTFAVVVMVQIWALRNKVLHENGVVNQALDLPRKTV